MTDLIGLFDQYIKPELVILLPVLYIINTVMEKTKLKEIHVPYILGGISILLCGIYTLATAQAYTIQSVLLSVFTSLTQGVLLAGASTYIEMLAVKIPRSCRDCGVLQLEEILQQTGTQNQEETIDETIQE